MRGLLRESIFALVILGLLFPSAGCATWSRPSIKQPETQRRPELVGANYYPWYNAARWINEEVTDTPSLGKYLSNNPEVIDQHILWASEAGIDFFLVEWCGEPGSPTDQAFRQMLDSRYSDKIKFAIFYDSAINLSPGWSYDDCPDFQDMFDETQKKGQKFLDDMTYIAREYFDQPQYLKLDGKPFVVFYPAGGWSNAGPYLDALNLEMASLGYDTYAVADLMGWDEDDVHEYPWESWRTHFEAITGGVMHCQAVIDDPKREVFLDELEERITQYRIEVLNQGMGFIPPVIAGFDNRDPEITAIPRDEGNTMRRSWDIATSNLDDKYNIVNIVTFNEWHEGSEIEPSEEYDMFYLNLLKELRGG